MASKLLIIITKPREDDRNEFVKMFGFDEEDICKLCKGDQQFLLVIHGVKLKDQIEGKTDLIKKEVKECCTFIFEAEETGLIYHDSAGIFSEKKLEPLFKLSNKSLLFCKQYGKTYNYSSKNSLKQVEKFAEKVKKTCGNGKNGFPDNGYEVLWKYFLDAVPYHIPKELSHKFHKMTRLFSDIHLDFQVIDGLNESEVKNYLIHQVFKDYGNTEGYYRSKMKEYKSVIKLLEESIADEESLKSDTKNSIKEVIKELNIHATNKIIERLLKKLDGYKQDPAKLNSSSIAYIKLRKDDFDEWFQKMEAYIETIVSYLQKEKEV